ncbi:hypothetical protein Daus18300_011949 [Diaporthe australafricana]|uniref:Uncharacterized protein n=1 Tax=Diaporthe australafricana TaxID=127596 RepID=A0ABR3W4K2_9PEZI
MNWLVQWLETLKGTRRDDTTRALDAETYQANIENLRLRPHVVHFYNKVFEAANWLLESNTEPMEILCGVLGFDDAADWVVLRGPITSYICSLVVQEFEEMLGFEILVDETNPVGLMAPISYSRIPSGLDLLISRGNGEDISASIAEKFADSLTDIMNSGLRLPYPMPRLWEVPMCPELIWFRALIRECVVAFVPIVDGLRSGLCFRAHGRHSPKTRFILYLCGFQNGPSQLKSYTVFPECIRFTRSNKTIESIVPECRVNYIQGATRQPAASELNGVASDVGDI